MHEQPDSVLAKEQKEEEKVVLRVIISRHGPKASASGEKNDRAPHFDESVRGGFAAMDIGAGEGLVRINASPVDRAMKTGEIYMSELGKTDHRQSGKGRVSVQDHLATPYQPEGEVDQEVYARDYDRIVAMQRALEPMIRERVNREHAAWSVEEQEKQMRNEIDQYILERIFEEGDPQWAGEQKFEVSYQTIADQVATRYVGFLRHIDLLAIQKRHSQSLSEERKHQSDNVVYIAIDVSHSFPIMAFLKKYLVFIDEKGGELPAEAMNVGDFFNRTGGVIRESQSFVLEYVVSGNDKKVRVSGEFEPGKKFEGVLNFDLLLR
jgi:hypothetical protein